MLPKTFANPIVPSGGLWEGSRVVLGLNIFVRGKLKRLIAPLAAALLITLAGCGVGAKPQSSGGGDSKSSSETSPSSGESESTGPQSVAFGQSVTVKTDQGTKLKLTISAPTDFTEETDFDPEKGKYVVVDAEAALAAGVVGNVSEDEFCLVDGEGNRYEPAIASMEISGSFIELLTDKDKPVTGKIIYDVPTDAPGLTVEYSPTGVNSKTLGPLASWK
ncbi:protein of unknown function (DUF4352) [Saccharopolyspora spinosa]|uniref:DUF4352 domain-containing protein n=1 Tax=Saccharopolyspora spinosa TaxID=60894 RepID=A0A2N3XSI4_SACSN|nr:protein of unknown function (DUF4352) [Saccharopolyspora spinosa]